MNRVGLGAISAARELQTRRARTGGSPGVRTPRTGSAVAISGIFPSFSRYTLDLQNPFSLELCSLLLPCPLTTIRAPQLRWETGLFFQKITYSLKKIQNDPPLQGVSLNQASGCSVK